MKHLYYFGLRFICLFDSKYDALLKTLVFRGTGTGNTVTSLKNIKIFIFENLNLYSNISLVFITVHNTAPLPLKMLYNLAQHRCAEL